MADDETATDEDATRLMEIPASLDKTLSAAVPDTTENRESAPTMALELPQEFRGDRTTDDEKPEAFEGEQTMLLEVDPVSQPSRERPPHLLDRRRAEPVRWDRLRRVTEPQRGAVDAMAELLPPVDTTRAATAEVEAEMERLLGMDHRIEYVGMAGVVTSGEALEFDDGIWIPGRVPPACQQFAAGVETTLADRWCGLVGARSAYGDDFEFGVLTYLIGTFCGVFCRNVGWPPWVWGVNPMSERDLKTMLLAGELPIVEIAFGVEFDGGGGAFRIWFPVGVVRRMAARGASSSGPDRAAELPDWCGELVIRRPLIAGTSRLSRCEFEEIGVGDVVVVDRHGVGVEAIDGSARPDGARWMIGRRHAVTGRIVEGGEEQWQFEVEERRVLTEKREVEVSETGQNESAEGERGNVDIDAARLTLEVRIGAVEMELSDLRRLRSGQVVDCGRVVGGGVDLMVGDTSVGRGELVDVDGRLGVRVLSMTGDGSTG